MGLKNLLLTIFTCFSLLLFSQNGSLVTSYTVSGCGLDFVQTSVRLNKRPFGITPATGVNQPATMSVTGIPTCYNIVKALLYVATSGNGVAITASMTNPSGLTQSIPMTTIGSDIDVCWNFSGTHAYRADVTSLITGNGNYTLSGIPIATAPSATANDANGATLIIIYEDQLQTYTGNLIIGDGCHAVTPNTPQFAVNTLTGFSVCGTPTLTQNFMLVADLQQLGNTLLNLNTSIASTLSSNCTKSAASDQVWDFIQAPGGMAVQGQSSASFGLFNVMSDCLAIVAAGMYYRTNCMSCQAPTINPNMTLAAASTPSCVSSATAFASGGLTPYTYVWTGTSQTASVATGLTGGQYTVTVSGVGGCGTASTSIEILSYGVNASATNPVACAGQTATLIANGGSQFLWTGPGAFTSTAQIITIPVTNTTTTSTYTVVVSNMYSCTGEATGVITVTNSPAVQASATKTLICAGNTVTLSASGAQSYTWQAATGTQTQSAITVTPGATSVYTLNGVTANGCRNSASITVNVSECTSVDEFLTGERDLLVYPNPGTGHVTVRAVEAVTLRLLNNLGQQLHVMELNEHNNYTFAVSDLAEGIYYLVPIGKQSFSTLKVVVKK